MSGYIESERSTASAGARKSAGNSSSRLFCALKNLLDLGIRLVHRFGWRQLAAVRFRKKDAECVFDFVPVRRARSRSRAFERAQLHRVRGVFRVAGNRDQPVTDLSLSRLLRTWQRRELHLPDHSRSRRVTKWTDPHWP